VLRSLERPVDTVPGPGVGEVAAVAVTAEEDDLAAIGVERERVIVARVG
jgi:hypothetical protein